jgi:2-polyprenyl-3-methyl-5-hydroxy-6-metoxy-1,4-benzoquinol methylase
MSPMVCRLCGSDRLELLYEVRGSTLDRCAACRFVQVRNQPSEEELRAIYADGYFTRGKYDDEFAQRRENERRASMLAEAGVPAGGRVLDAGCATGDFVAFASDRYDMWGLDVSEFATRIAREKNPERADQIFTGFVEDQEFESAFFDAIVMWDVIEHIWDPRAVLHQLVQHLRPGGTLILSTPDIGAVTARLMRRRWAFMTPPEHLGFFSPPSLAYLLEQDLGLRTTSSHASGKWANVGFLAYKLRRVFPVVPQALVTGVQRSPLGKATLYVPTLDVRYISARKPEA